MKFLVCISLVPDTTTKISFVDNDTKFNTDKVQWILNPYDEWYALVRALELKEANGGTVTVINVGGAANDATIRKALAIGADDAIRIDASGDLDSYAIASEIAAVAKSGGYDLVLLGKETISDNGSNVGGMVAELLDLPFISYASKLDVAGSTATIERDIEGGEEILSVDAPFVISCAKGMAEARIPNMKGIMAAKTKPLNVVTPQGTASLTATVKYELPPAKSACKMISPDNVGELVQLLHNEAKVI
ncbi:MAG TPA: electron transfer flavoprotein subunit beta/FixA family protein [Chitinophagales bacterium]|nr:electron transfer flavoprotein subunit beta/FixA family protein [Chitinophagales bacterium]HMV03153.1 electron transfer flavoprotein subunit beta/FixA family protein [Chitinophagales bacterium]HMW94650.1 electron transfer flavoprotein subunit beta/FixA family protein [Chitinophagales bacterium]HMZ68248.1 electron transfer flavoprotein subunit beta/FixA family protein [Chitinophagales bacterium]HMZ93780.1 electron transfer flavoprotein subunit beta/FixA family protein [Chitinophagales bacteri